MSDLFSFRNKLNDSKRFLKQLTAEDNVYEVYNTKYLEGSNDLL